METWNLSSTHSLCFDETWQRLHNRSQILMRYQCVALGYRLTLCIKFTAAPVSSSAWNRQPQQTNPLETVYCMPRGYSELQAHTYNSTHTIKHIKQVLFIAEMCTKPKDLISLLQFSQVTCMKLNIIWSDERVQVLKLFWTSGKSLRTGDDRILPPCSIMDDGLLSSHH